MRGQLARLLDEDADTEAVATKALGATFVVALLVVVGLAIAPIGSGEQYTEFYVLGPDGTASEYPENVTVGETADLRVGIGNFEHQPRTYTLVVRTNETTFVTRTVDLDAREEWEEPISVVFDSPSRKTLHLELYVGQTTTGEPYRSLWLFVEVTRGGST